MRGVYIKGMEMPKTCSDCHLCEQTDYYASPYCRVSDDDDMMCINEIRAKRRDNCPLIPAPDHGRLIDADALIKELTLDDEDDNSGASLLMAIFLEVLKAAPTIIPAEDAKLSATIKCGDAVTCTVAYSEEVYNKYVDTAGNLRWTGTHSGEHIIPAEEGET